MKFHDFGFDERLIEGIEAVDYQVATPVQEKVIPLILAGNDIIASAQTGTGKTAAYLLPLIHKITAEKQNDFINALVIVPTRELAIQIAQNLEGLSYFTSISSIAVYGGNDGDSFTTEKRALSTGADIVICTPGRMISHLNQGYVKIKRLQYLVLDEADRMLDMGFHDDIMKIISHLPADRQNLLFSATMPYKIKELARRILVDPVEVTISVSKPPSKIDQKAFVVFEQQKIPLIKQLLRSANFTSVLIFCSRKATVKQLTAELKRSGLSVEEIHSDLTQATREQSLLDFKNRKVKVLIATDILSRGIDIEDINLVINFDVPHDVEDYIHRIGRTARAETDGIAYTLVGEREQEKFLAIEELLGKPVEKGAIPPALGETPPYQPRKFRPGRSRRKSPSKRS